MVYQRWLVKGWGIYIKGAWNDAPYFYTSKKSHEKAIKAANKEVARLRKRIAEGEQE